MDGRYAGRGTILGGCVKGRRDRGAGIEKTPGFPGPRRRILHILYSPAAEGCPKLALDMVRLHDAGRYEAGVAFCTPEPPDMLADFQKEGNPIFHLGWRRRGFLPLAWRTYRLCRRWKPDGIVCYTLGLHVSIALGARLAGVRRVVLHIGNTPPDSLRQRRKIGWSLQASRTLVRREVCCSRTVERAVSEMYGLPPRRLGVVYNAAPVEEIHLQSLAGRKQAHQDARNPIIGMVARLEAHKDHETLLHAFKLVLERHPGATLRLVGDGSLRPALEALAQRLGVAPAVQFLGSRRDVPRQLAGMDIFVFSTTPSEGFGIALVEAMAAGTPVIASDVGACREVLGGGLYGRLVPPGDPAALASNIAGLLDDPEERRRLGLAAYAHALEQFDAQRMTRGYEEALFS